MKIENILLISCWLLYVIFFILSPTANILDAVWLENFIIQYTHYYKYSVPSTMVAVIGPALFAYSIKRNSDALFIASVLFGIMPSIYLTNYLQYSLMLISIIIDQGVGAINISYFIQMKIYIIREVIFYLFILVFIFKIYFVLRSHNNHYS